MNKILVVGPSWVGDMVMAQTLFKAIKAQDPAALIDVLAPDWSRPLLERMPEVRYAHAMPIGHGALALKLRAKIANSLKPYAYTQAIVLPNSWKSAFIPWWASIPKRTGYKGEFRYGVLNDVRILDKKQLPKMIDRFVALAYDKNTKIPQNIAYPHLEINQASCQKAQAKFLNEQEANRPILALCPGAEFGPSKRWPERYYAEVAVKKLKEGWQVLLFGSKKDQVVADKIQELTQNQCVDLTGKTNLDEAIDLLSLAKMVISNDSGLMHVAAALQRPLVAVYGSTDPGFTPPLGQTSKIVRLTIACSPCFKRECPLTHHRCMETLSSEKVITAMNSLVN